jgi:tetratricopeptide (TPR) repeat protein
LLAASARGQLIDRSIPSRTYFAGVEALYRGDYQGAQQQFQRELRGAVKTPQSRWIDSICYYAMLGEAYYLAGQNAEALEQFNNAAQLYLAFPQWMLRVDFPNVVPDANRARQDPPPWGRSQRNATLGRFPDGMPIHQGQQLTEEQLLQGGVITPPQIWTVNVKEIVRCTALAIRRRNQLLGPLAPHDDASSQLASQLRRGGAPPNHWSSAWVDVELGLAEVGLDRIAEAQKNLGSSLVIAGQFDHPLTGVALLEQGRLMMQSGQLQAAARLFEEASYAAYYFDDLGVIEEALALGLEAHVLGGANGVYPPLEVAAAWAQRKNWKQIQAHMLLLLVESLAASGQPESADRLLKTEVPRVLSRRTLPRGRLLAKYRYLTALVAYQMNRPDVAAEALQEAIAFQTASSLWNFHIALADQMFDARRLTGKTSRDIYATLLGDPQASDWAARPMESLGVLSLPHVESFDRWFLATLDQREAESALAVADLAHRRRFLSSLPLGGRLLALAHVLETPEAALPQAALLQRQDLLVRMPAYQDLLRDTARIRRSLAQGPLVPPDDAARKEQAQQFAELAQFSRVREVLLRRLALSRQASDILFPPALGAPELQAALKPGEVLILYHQLQGRLYGFAITRSQYTTWQVGPVSRVQTAVAALLREIGNVDPNREIDPQLLLGDKWRTHAAELYDLLLGEAQLDLAQTSGLIVIPDHVLWYVPFEALLYNSDPTSEPLIARVPLRYCPLAGLAVGDIRPLRRVARTAVAVGQMYPRTEDVVAAAAYEELAQAVPTAEKLTDPLTGPSSLVASLADELIVLNEIEPAPKGSPYGWTPLPIGRMAGGDSLADWLLLPADGPQRVVLPAFHTPAEEALRGVARTGRPGDDLFAATCGLMAAGAKTVLISRWRTGGKSAFDFVREFAQELPHTAATDAWQRSILLTRASSLDVMAEPRISRLEGVDAPPTAAHPFFWAGYMLADTGTTVKADVQPAPLPGGAAKNAP